MGVNIQSYNKKLLARPEQNLEDHLKEVSEYGISYLKENLKEEFTEEKEKIYKAGLFFHDVGKSEISIQNAYYNKKKPPIFHTHLSVIFFYSWLIDFLKKDLYELLNDKKLKVISFCILSHHGPPHRKLEYNIFSQILNKDKKISIAKEVFGILKSFDFCVTEKTFIDTYNKFIKGYGENIYEFHFATALTPDLRKSFSIFYNALVKSDWYSAMGIPPTFQVKSATKVSLPSDFLEPERSEVHKYIHERQEFKENILLELPTGFGKTFLGLGYALKTKRKRIIYTLPVTTIIEDVYENSLKKYINEKYLEWYTSRYLVLKSLKKKEKKEELEQTEYLEAKYFEKPIIITTLDQLLLAFLGVDRYPLKEASIYDSCIILDEPQLYSPLMLFLFSKFFESYREDFNIIIMTATFPDFLKNKIKQFFIEPFKISSVEKIFAKYNRVKFNVSYLGCSIQSKEFQKIISKLISGNKKIAFIFNTVEKAQNFYRNLSKHVPKYLFHARYIYRDRVNKLSELKEKLSKAPIIVVSTQAIEAGVNISFDLMFRELAPFDSLIQSAGRVNRFNEHPNPCPIYIFGNEEDFLPYKRNQLKITKEILLNLKINSELDFYMALREYWKRIEQDLKSDEGKAEKLFNAVTKISPFSIDLDEGKVNLRDTYFKVSVIPIKFYDEIKKLLEKYASLSRENYWEKKKILAEIESYMVEVPFWSFKDFLDTEEGIQFINLKYDSDLGLLAQEENFSFI